MIEYITQDQAVALALQFGIEQTPLFGNGDIQSLCNAAIERFIEDSVSELTGEPYKIPAGRAQ